MEGIVHIRKSPRMKAKKWRGGAGDIFVKVSEEGEFLLPPLSPSSLPLVRGQSAQPSAACGSAGT